MTTDRTMNSADAIITFNEWMRRYIDEPERFLREFQAVREFLRDEAEGNTPSYGQECAAYQFKLLDELSAGPAS